MRAEPEAGDRQHSEVQLHAEFGLHNATAPKGGAGLLALTNFQAGGLWSGIEFAFASFLMDHGRYADGVEDCGGDPRRYMRAGRPWNHVECGGHYSRAMSSWATMLAASGFKPDVANEALSILPGAPGDFHAPWVTDQGFGTIGRAGRTISIRCAYGTLRLRKLKLAMAEAGARIGGKTLAAKVVKSGDGVTLEFESQVTLAAGRQ